MPACTRDAFQSVMLDPHPVALAMGLMVLQLVDFDR
jgi:hypothetical protein